MVAGHRHTHPLLSAYKTRTRHGRRSQTHTPSPLCLQDPHEAWSPVRDTHTLSSLPTRPARGMVAGQRHTHPLLSAYKTRTRHGRRSETHTPSLLCLQDPHEAWSPVRDTHTLSSLPTRPARGMVAGQRHTHPLLSAYKTRTRHGRRSETHTPSPLCLQDPHEAWSPVRDTHILSSLPTRPARGMVAGHRHTHPLLSDPHEAWSPVTDTHTLSSLPTRPVRGMVAGHRHTHPLLSAYKTRTRHGRRSETHTPSPLCLQDPHEARSPVRDTHTLSSLPTRPARGTVAGQRHTHPLLPAYKTRTRHGRRSETHTSSPLCLQDPHEAWSPVRDTHILSSLPTRPARGMVAGQRRTHPLLSAYKTLTYRSNNITIILLNINLTSARLFFNSNHAQTT